MSKFINDQPPQQMNNMMGQPTNNNSEKDSKKNQIYILLGVALASALVMGLIFFIIDSGDKKEDLKDKNSNVTEKKEEPKKEEPKKEEPTPVIPSEPEEPATPEPEKEERKQYYLTCKQQNGFYSYTNTFTFDKDKNKVIEVNNKYYIPAYGNQDTHNDEELANIKNSAKSTETMIIYLNLDKGGPGVKVNQYDTSNDTLNLDITFIESEIQNQDVYNFAFGPIKNYTFQTMYELDEKYDICSIS